MPRWRRRFLLDALRDLREVARIAEVFVDAREPNVGDVVERLEANHHRLADAASLHLIAQRFHLPLDAADQPVDARRIDVTLAAGVADRTSKLVAVERFPLPVLLDDGEVTKLDTLECREAGPAGLALAPAPDRRSILARAAVLHLAVFMGAKGATHQL